MTIEELRTKLKKIVRDDEYDPESNHADADALLLKYIGDSAVTRLYNEIEKWYA